MSAPAVITFFYPVGVTIPDGDFNGYRNSQTVSGFAGLITDLNVTLNISSGFNGDFYAYLRHNGTTAILLNRVGRSATSAVGYPDSGFGTGTSGNLFTLDDQATGDVHSYRSLSYSLNASGQLTGPWQPDGRTIDPLSAGSAFDAASRPAMLGIFNGMDPNGVWSLYVSDLSAGGEGTLVGWGLEISAVPEPSTATLLASGAAALLLLGRQRRKSM